MENRDINTQIFTEGMVKDMSATFTKKGTWNHARNAQHINHTGEIGTIGNEPANKLLVTAPYPIIAFAYVEDDRWVVFSTDDLNSEIGIFDESDKSYKKVINQDCLNFKQVNKITAEVKKNFDCTHSVYWTDAGNTDRYLNLSRPPYIPVPDTGVINKCDIKYTDQVDCAKLAMSGKVKTPVMRLQKGTGAGTLLNGSYQVVIGYSVNGIRSSNYSSPSNVQSLFSHQNTSGSLELLIDDIDTEFDEFELVVISNINRQAQAKRFGIYSTRQHSITIDYIDQTLVTIPLEFITNRTLNYDKSDSLVNVNSNLLRIGVRTKPDFNYQPQANKIDINWVAVEVPADYYYKGGNLTSYMRDEVQPFTIHWVDNGGGRSAEYPLVGRAPDGDDLDNATGDDVYEMDEETPVIRKKWEIENTAKITSIEEYDIAEGRVIAEGTMAYWESTELYPQKPLVWDKLCGKPIRHPKFPDNALVPHMSKNGTKIVLLAVKFSGITHPLDMNGDPIPDIVGYEIMKANPDGNKTIIAKGIVNNAGEYTIPDGVTNKKGLYANYPFNDLRTDPFLSADIVKGGCAGHGYTKMGTFRKDVFSFHSPETQFRNPFLSTSELKVYGELSGTVTGGYESVFKHPKHKLIRDFALLVSGLVGVGAGMLAIKGKRTNTVHGAHSVNPGLYGVVESVPAGAASLAAYNAAMSALDAAESVAKFDITGASDALIRKAKLTVGSALGAVPGSIGAYASDSVENTAISELPLPLRILNGVILFSFYFAQGTESTLRIIRNLVPFQQYAVQYNSHGFYDKINPVKEGNTRRKITDASYVEPHLQEFTNKYRINNLFRGRNVVVQLGKELSNPTVVDNTRQSIGDLRTWKDPFRKFQSTTSAYYAGLKIPIKNQYGQIDSLRLLPISSKVEPTTPDKTKRFTSSVLFGGHVYINRYTEKNSFFYFNDWMYDMIDGTEWNYNNNYNIPNPRYWINTNEYDVSQLTSALSRFNFSEDALPNDLAHLDRETGDCKAKVSFIIKNGYFYLFNNGVRDFFVESEVNLALRDHDELDAQRHYDAHNYTDLSSLFRSSIIKAGNHYKYDYSLSISKLLLNTVSWGSMLPRDYDPLNQKCFSYYPNRVIYSLQQQDELKKDNWLVYLANNYKDFPSKITTIKPVNQSGVLILFDNESPLMFRGVDTLQTDGGTKILLGDGGLFNQQMEQLSNSHRAYEYGSCQNTNAIESTPYGLFWMSVDQGKIFSFGQGMQDITQGIKYWFSQYMPFLLLKEFPGFELQDNPFVGISAQTIYDNTNGVIYFCKKDYELKPEFQGRVTYKGSNDFTWNNNSFKLGDKHYFNDASWTISYDVAEKKWISFHDWHPDLLLPGKNHFISVKGDGIWKHNERNDLYCNFYGVNYPFEVGYTQSTGQDITTTRSFEYQLECFKYYNNGRDKHNILDENFDRFIMSNIEENSGLVKLKIKPKNSPMSIILPTQSEAEAISMFCSKEENKYRINGIYDLTRDRGEFSGTTRPMWITEPNGYIKAINPVNINYQKPVTKRKKMRHYDNDIFFRKNVSGSSKFLLKIVNSKLQQSER